MLLLSPISSASLCLFSKDEHVTPIVEEVNLDYARTMNSMIFEEVTQSDPISFAFITLPTKLRRSVPHRACISIPEYSFNEVFDQFKVRTAIEHSCLFTFPSILVHLSAHIEARH